MGDDPMLPILTALGFALIALALAFALGRLAVEHMALALALDASEAQRDALAVAVWAMVDGDLANDDQNPR